jgi:ribosomal protein S27AE
MSVENDWWESVDTDTFDFEEATNNGTWGDFHLYDNGWWWAVYRSGDEPMHFKERWHAMQYIQKVMKDEGYSANELPTDSEVYDDNLKECAECGNSFTPRHSEAWLCDPCYSREVS